MRALRLFVLVAVAMILPRISFAQFVIEGVVHESDTLAPVSGVAVFLVDDDTGDVVSPGELTDPSQQGRVTGEDGRYLFEVQTVRRVRLSLDRQDLRFVFPSAERPPPGDGPLGGVACSTISCPNGEVDPSTAPTESGTYALRFSTNTPGSARNNHVPVDKLDRLITATLDADRRRVRRGQHVLFEARFTSRQTTPIDDFEAVLSLPPELRLLEDSVRVVRTARTSSTTNVATVNATQADLLWRLPISIAPNETVAVRAIARAVQVPDRNRPRVRAWLERPGGILVTQQAALTLAIEGDPTLDTSTIFGRVFCDGEDGRVGWQDEGEPGLFGVRVYLDTGFYAQTDENGLFHFSGVPPGTHLVKLDDASLPPPSEPTTPIRAQLYLSPGTPGKVRFGVACRLEDWNTAERVHTTTVSTPLAGGARTVEVSLTAAERRLSIAGRAYQFMRAELRAVDKPNGVRFFPLDVAPFTPTRWRIEIDDVDSAGQVARTVRAESLTGRGPPPLFVDWFWDRPPSAVYRARLVLLADESDEATSADVDFGVPPPTPPSAPDLEAFETVATIDASEDVVNVDAAWSALEGRLADGVAVGVVGHWDAADEDPAARAFALAESVQAMLVERGVAPERIFVGSRGAEVPIVPNISARLRVKNRRVDVRVGAAPPAAAPRPKVPAREVRSASLRLDVDNKSGEVPLERWSDVDVTIDVEAPATLQATLRGPSGDVAILRRVVTVDWVTRTGERVAQPLSTDGNALTIGDVAINLAPYALTLGAVRVKAGDGAVTMTPELSVATRPEQWSLALFDTRGERSILAERSGLADPLPGTALTVTSTVVFARPTTLAWSATFPGGLRVTRVRTIEALGEGDRVLAAEAERAPVLVVPGARRLLSDPIDPVDRTILVAGSSVYAVPIVGLENLDRAKSPTAMEAPERTPASDVTMRVAQAGQTQARLFYPIVGTTVPTNVVRVAGERVAVAPSGSFSAVVPLKPGENVVRVETEDVDGNRAVFERTVVAASTSWFLLAMGDAQVSLGNARLAGSNRHTHVDAGPLSLDGRAVAYGRARTTLDEGPFEQVEVVGRIDTGALEDATVRRLEDDPLRMLPAFGDAGLEVQETSSRYKVDVTVKADESTLAVGNRTTTLEGLSEDGYFAFRRAGFGVHVDFDERFGELDETEIRGMVGLENDGTRRGHDEIGGTGGTMYWLSNRDLVEGSERIALVVRDRDTGFVLERVEKQRGVDYEIRPHEGRIVFREPVAHAVSMAQTGINRSVALSGHPIYIVVDYTYLASGAGDLTFGVEARETIAEQFEVFGAVAGENLDGTRHRIYGFGLAYRPTQASFLEFEYAGSSGETTAGRLSTDGGLSFIDLDLSSRLDEADFTERTGPFFGALDSNAFRLSGQLSIGDLFADEPLEARPTGYVRAYGRKAGLRFSSLGSARQSGRLEGGVAASYDFTPEVTARASFDAASYVRPEQLATTNAPEGLFRGLATAGVTYRSGRHGLGFELQHLMLDDGGNDSTTGMSGRYDHKYSDDLTLTIGQSALVDTDLYTSSNIGVLATTAGATYRLTESMEIALFETVRWNGDNATQLGVRVRNEGGLSSYVAERFTSTGGVPALTTVIGAEDIVAEGSRTYGELQMGGAFDPTASRAVIGMDNRWRVGEGVDLLLAYERAHLLASNVQPNANAQASAFTAPFGGLSATLGGFGRPAQILPGAVSRDALATGIVLTRVPNLKLSARGELRIDNGDQAVGGRDFRVVGGHLGALWSITRDVSALARLTGQHVTDTNANVTYAKALEGSVGAMFRPRAEDWFTLIVRYTRLDQQRPRSLEDDRRVSETRDALSVEPIVDTPWNVQLVERFALVSSESSSDLGTANGVNVLWINRVNARPIQQVEGGVEYRMLVDLDTNTSERGFLLEVGYLPSEHIRIGAGYNFTRFSDDVLTLLSQDARGPFLRVTARY